MKLLSIIFLFFSAVNGYSITWSSPTTIYNGGCVFNTLQASIDENGVGFAVWNKENVIYDQVLYSYQNSGVWTDANIEYYRLRYLKAQSFSVNSSVIGFLISFTTKNQSASEYTDTFQLSQLISPTNWSNPFSLSLESFACRNGHVEIGLDGTAIAVCESYDGTNSFIRSSNYYLGNWAVPEILSNTSQDSINPRVSIKNLAVGSAIWSAFNGTNYEIQTRLYSEGAWASSNTLTTSSNNALYPDIATNASAESIAVWGEYFPTGYLCVHSSSTVLGVWSSPELISSPVIIKQFPEVVIDSSGNGCCIWTQNDGSTDRITSAIFTAGTPPSYGTWGTPSYISDTGKIAYKGKIVTDGSGNYVCLWRQKEGANFTLIAATYDGTWSTPQTLSDVSSTVDDYVIDINSSGEILVVWENIDRQSNKTIICKTASF